MDETPKDIKYVCDKVDEIANGVYNLRARPIGKVRFGLYAIVFGTYGFCFANMLENKEVKTQLSQIQTELKTVETKMDTLERMLIETQQKDK